ncbi:MAG: hypothetical protein D6741_08100, partial [Planctomycetota bacterium]
FAVEQVDRLALRSKTRGRVVVDPSRLRSVPSPVVREWLHAIWVEQGWPLRDMSARHWHRLEIAMQEAAEPPTRNRGLLTLPGEVDVRRDGDVIVITRRPTPEHAT